MIPYVLLVKWIKQCCFTVSYYTERKNEIIFADITYFEIASEIDRSFSPLFKMIFILLNENLIKTHNRNSGTQWSIGAI